MGAGTEKRHSDRPAENNRRYAAERVSHTVASRETVLTVSAQIDSVCRLLFGGAGLRWRPLHESAEAPTEPGGETLLSEAKLRG